MEMHFDPPERFRDAIDRLHETVTDDTGFDDFGPVDYIPGLTVLLQSMDYDARFTDMGRRVAWGMVVEALRGRAHAIRSMKDNPGFDGSSVLAPVVITGVPRTGTTALHRLMAVDPRFQGLQTWLLDYPMPRPPIDTWSDWSQFRTTAENLAVHYENVPEAKAIHLRAAEEVHECCMLLRQAFVTNIWSCGWTAPTYDAWWQSVSEAPAYDYFRRCVQLIGSSEPEKRWLLKNPGHIENLDLLFATFPDAMVIQTHRDPAKAIPSLVSLLMQSHPIMEEGRADQRAAIMMRRETVKWARAVAKADTVRQRHPGQVMDVVHGDFHRDPMAVLEGIYAFIGLEIPDATRADFARRIEEKPELAHGAHRYDIRDYGMSADEAREPFGDYVRRFDLLESRA